MPVKRKRPAAPTTTDRALARRLRHEIRNAMALIQRGPVDDRARGQLEALRHMETVIEIAEKVPRAR